MYEFTITAMLLIVGAYLVMVWRTGARWLGLPVTLLAAAGNGLAVTVFYVAVAPLVPALHSVWFVIHIIAAATSGAAFNIGGLLTILFLIKQRAERRGRTGGYLARIPTARKLDLYAYRFFAFAFPLWTFTVAAGAIWAEYAWGRYWGWDPKETWALVTWVVYACYLHARSTAGWRGTRAAVIALVGLASFWFNFVGINLLVSGLHSYAGI
jgi:cytochrome c-type biogenesis protein CcsB